MMYRIEIEAEFPMDTSRFVVKYYPKNRYIYMQT